MLVIGGGGREHAIVHALSQSPQVEQVFASPGNFGTATASNGHCSCQNVPAMTHNEVVQFAEQHEVSLVVVGPERPLAEGLVDLLHEKVRPPDTFVCLLHQSNALYTALTHQTHRYTQGIAAFGPSAAAARIEASKAWSKHFMQQNNIPTAEFRTFSDFSLAKQYVESVKHRVVVKVRSSIGIVCIHVVDTPQ